VVASLEGRAVTRPVRRDSDARLKSGYSLTSNAWEVPVELSRSLCSGAGRKQCGKRPHVSNILEVST